MKPSEREELREALFRLRMAFHRRLARRLNLPFDEAQLSQMVRARSDQGVLAELEAQSRRRSEVALLRWLRKLLSGG